MTRDKKLQLVCLSLFLFVLALLYPRGASAQSIVSITTTNPANAANITASVSLNNSTGAYTVTVRNTGNADTFELSPSLSTASTVKVVFNASLSAADPKIAVSTGLISDWKVDTSVSPHQITFTAAPRATSWSSAGCSLSSCATTATTDYQALLLAAFDPLTALPASDFTTKIVGGFTSTNGQYFDPRPSYNTTTKALDLHVGAPHLKTNGVTLNSGFARMFVPDAIITDLWGISGGSTTLKNNAALTTVTVGGSAASFSVDQLTTSGGITGALIEIGEVTPFGYSVPDVVVTPVSNSVTAPQPRTPPFPASIVAVAGTPQSTSVSTPFAAPLQVMVRDEYGAGFPNAIVTFIAPSSGPSLAKATASATTDANGIASLNATANTVSGSFQVTVSTSGLGGSSMSVTLTLTNNGGAPVAINATAGTPQTASVNSDFNTPLQVTVRDTYGNAVSGATVAFMAGTASNASAVFPSGNTAITDTSGQASVTAHANSSAGAYIVTASSGTASPATFNLTNTQTVLVAPALASGVADQLSITWANPFPKPVMLTLTARGYDGQLIAGAGIQNPSQLEVAPGGEIARPVGDIFGGAITGYSGWVQVASSDPTGGGGFFLLCGNAFQACDGGPLIALPASRLVFPQASSSTILHVVNTGTQPARSVALLVYDNGGRLLDHALFSVPAQGGWTGRVGDLLPSFVVDGYAVIDSRGALFSSPSPLIGMATYQNRDNAVIIGQDASAPMRTGYATHIISGGGYTSRVRLVNPNTVPQSVQMTLNGISIQTTIPANGRLDQQLDQIFTLSAVLTTGYLTVQTPANTSGIIGLVEISTADGQFLTSERITEQDAVQLLFPQAMQGRGYWTGLALLNARQSAASVNIELDTPTGATLGTKAVTLAPGQRLVGMLTEWFPGSSTPTGGSVRVTSTSPIYGVQFLGTTGENGANFLATVPALE